MIYEHYLNGFRPLAGCELNQLCEYIEITDGRSGITSPCGGDHMPYGFTGEYKSNLTSPCGSFEL